MCAALVDGKDVELGLHADAESRFRAAENPQIRTQLFLAAFHQPEARFPSEFRATIRFTMSLDLPRSLTRSRRAPYAPVAVRRSPTPPCLLHMLLTLRAVDPTAETASAFVSCTEVPSFVSGAMCRAHGPRRAPASRRYRLYRTCE